MKNKILPLLFTLIIIVFLSGMNLSDPRESRNPGPHNNSLINPVVMPTNAVIKFVDSLNGANDTVSLRNRGYIPKRGPLSGPAGSIPNWIQGVPANFTSFNGPDNGYIAGHFNNVTGSNQIDLWLILPAANINAGDTLSFFERSPTGSTFPDSARVYYASNGDTVPGSPSFTELGRFKGTTTGSWQERRFTAPVSSLNGRFAINYRVIEGGPNGNNSDFWGVDYIRILGSSIGFITLPEMLYYKFTDNINATTVLNCGTPGAGTWFAPINSVTLVSGGQFDSCLSGTGLTGGGITTGWNCNLGNRSWTISMWIEIPTTSSGSAFYLFGDPGAGSFRCFHNGIALPNNLVLRGTGITDVTVTDIGPQPAVVTFVYDSASSQLKAYKNGLLVNSSSQTLNIPLGTGFKVAGYGTSLTLNGKMDEFRLYNRALTPAEVLSSWNFDISGCGVSGISNTNNGNPKSYSLEQNYPNPFNPATNIKYQLAKSSYVSLKVYDALGREILTLVNENQTPGTYTVDFYASVFSSGVYFYRIEAGDFTASRKMLLVK